MYLYNSLQYKPALFVWVQQCQPILDMFKYKLWWILSRIEDFLPNKWAVLV